MKLALGTVQFGLDYGINNKLGQVKQEEVRRILEFCRKNGICMLDTSAGYGISEKVLGEYISGDDDYYQVITKIPTVSSEKEALEVIQQSFNNLRLSQIYGYLIHHFGSWQKTPVLWQLLKDLKEKKHTQKIGFSLYHPWELDCLFQNRIIPDIIQIPYSIFDQRFAPYFEEIKKENIEIHVRSVFLQGLVFSKIDALKERFKPLIPKLENLQKLADDHNLSISSLCFNFAALNKYIDKIVIGVDSVDNLVQNYQIQSEGYLVQPVLANLSALRENNEEIILPVNWKINLD